MPLSFKVWRDSDAMFMSASSAVSVTSNPNWLGTRLCFSTKSVNIEQKELVEPWLRYCHQQGSILASYCTGSFLLAECGLLSRKVATTHWRSADLFRKLYPFIRLDSEELIVDNGDVVCSGGAMAYIDLALYLIEKSFLYNW